jgi:protein AbiQ
MKIVKLDQSFFIENKDLAESMHSSLGGDESQEKIRGYGVVTIRLQGGLLFGIPLRSHIAHKSAFKTVGYKGLDYSKAVLLEKPEYVSKKQFSIPQDEFDRIVDKELFIRERFEKYVKKYITGATSNDKNILREYQYSTLQNYHVVLGIVPAK